MGDYATEDYATGGCTMGDMLGEVMPRKDTAHQTNPMRLSQDHHSNGNCLVVKLCIRFLSMGVHSSNHTLLSLH